jgi:glucose/arabinose dehydrogenase
VDGKNIVDQSDFMTGFLQGNQAIGRPVDLEFDQNGSLYVSDDKAGVVYLITRTSL